VIAHRGRLHGRPLSPPDHVLITPADDQRAKIAHLGGESAAGLAILGRRVLAGLVAAATLLAALILAAVLVHIVTD
jgi:hypothetical protein